MTRRARSHGLTRPAAKRLLRRPLGVLAMAVTMGIGALFGAAV